MHILAHCSLTGPYMQEREPLTWDQRCKILLGTAMGLGFCHPLFLHLNLKCHNILLDSDYTAKIADFSVCNVAPGKIGSTSFVPVSSVNCLIANRGYFPHELIDGVVSEKTDSYSYGIVIVLHERI